MTDQHSITPLPKKLLSEWDKTWHSIVIPTDPRTYSEYMYDQCAQWGADQQLAEDADWLNQHALDAPHLKITPVGESLKEAMRPKPPSLKEQALESVKRFELGQDENTCQYILSDLACIRRALEALPND